MKTFENRPEFAQQILNKRCLKENCYVSQAALVIKYLRMQNESEEHIHSIIEKMVYALYGTKNRPDITEYINPCFKNASRNPELETKTIYISKAELEFIHQIGNIKLEQFVFTALCEYKYFYTNDKYILLCDKVFTHSKIGGCRKDILVFAGDNPYFDFEPYKSKNYLIPTDYMLSLENYDVDGITISNFINFQYYYLDYFHTGRFIRCKECGCIEKMTKNNQYLCKICASKVHIDKVNSKYKPNEDKLKYEKVPNSGMILYEYKSGKKISDISKEFSINYRTVQTIINRDKNKK